MRATVVRTRGTLSAALAVRVLFGVAALTLVRASGSAPVVAAAVNSQATPAVRSTDGPIYEAVVIPASLQQDFTQKRFRRDPQSGNYLGPKVSAKTLPEPLVPIQINGKYVKDVRGQMVFLRKTIRDKLVAADAAMFKAKKDHVKVTYGFRSNVVQYDLYQRLNGHGKVAPPGMSFHETGMALDIANWREAQRFMIEAGFVGGCYGIEEDFVHYSVNEITKASGGTAFKRCTLKEIPENIFKGVKKVGDVMTAGFHKKK